MNYQTFPSVRSGIVVWGRGYGVRDLQGAEWMKSKSVWYWGDIDLRGFHILSVLRGSFPDVKSLMMDMETYREFSSFAVPSAERDLDGLENLTPDEALVLDYLRDQPEKNRLEQERISRKHLLKKMPVSPAEQNPG